jgi:hypothetical protein
MENLKADLLTGYKFFRNTELAPTFGILRLDTEGEPRFVMVTRKGLLALADACRKHADEFEETQ